MKKEVDENRFSLRIFHKLLDLDMSGFYYLIYHLVNLNLKIYEE